MECFPALSLRVSRREDVREFAPPAVVTLIVALCVSLPPSPLPFQNNFGFFGRILYPHIDEILLSLNLSNRNSARPTAGESDLLHIDKQAEQRTAEMALKEKVDSGLIKKTARHSQSSFFWLFCSLY